MSLLSICNLVTTFDSAHGEVRAVDSISYDIAKGETVGLVGESGCGKSVTGMSILRLIPSPPGRIAGGEVLYDGRDLLRLPPKAMRGIRGKEIAMIFQEPMTSLNPVYTVGNQIGEVLRLHRGRTRREAFDEAIELLRVVGIPKAELRVKSYPHEMSGGMRQRVMIAMAIACSPKLLIADEPTTALDVTIQAQILDLLRRLQQQHSMSILMISHDLGVIAEVAHRVVVMYAGRIVEIAQMKKLYESPLHPYTRALYASLPSRDEKGHAQRLTTIPGSVPPLHALPLGCKFSNRCEFATEECREREPLLREIEPNHFVRCIHADRWLQANRSSD